MKDTHRYGPKLKALIQKAPTMCHIVGTAKGPADLIYFQQQHRNVEAIKISTFQMKH